MPAKLDRCVSDVKAEGKSEDSAWAICNSSVKEGQLATGMRLLTAKLSMNRMAQQLKKNH